MSCTLPPPTDQSAIADTGASSHYLRPNDPHFKAGINKPPITVGLPNGDLLQSITQAVQLPKQDRYAHIIPGLTHSSLVSIGKPCDAGYEATFKKDEQDIRSKTNI